MHSSSSKAHHNGRIRAAGTLAPTLKQQQSTPTSVSSDSVSCAATVAIEQHEHKVTTVTTTTSSGRVVAPLPLHTPTTYQSLVSTLSAIGPIASTSSRTVGSWGRSAFGQLAGTARRVVSEGSHSHSAASGVAGVAPAGHVPPPTQDDDVDVDTVITGDLHSHLPGIDEQQDNEDSNDATYDEQLSASIHHRPSPNDDAILFSAWDCIPATRGGGGNGSAGTTRVLIQVFKHSGRIKVWDASDLHALVEVLNVQFGSIVEHREVYPVQVGFVPGAAREEAEEEHAPLLAILASDNAIHIYSTASHRVVRRLSVDNAGQFVNFQVNERFLVAAAIQPLSLYVWNPATFDLLPFSPITDLASHPYDHTPVYCLSSSRLLAYSSPTSPAYGGSGIIATSGWNEASSGTSTNTATSSVGANAASATGGRGSAGSRAGSGNAAGGGGPDYGETARRWGEGMMSHMKAVTDYGYSRYYGNQNHSSGSPSGLTPPSNQHSPAYYRNIATSGRSDPSTANHVNKFSKSAPHPSSPFYSRSPDAGNARLSASPTAGSGTGRVPLRSPRVPAGGNTSTSSSSSSVVVIDLVASMKSFDVSSSSSRPNSSLSAAQRSRSPLTTISRSSTPNAREGQNGVVAIAHFKPSKNHPLTLLSINPTGTLILTSSSEGHSFHVFELRPPSYIGNSSIRTSSPSRTSASGAAASSRTKPPKISNPDLKVWHRYRLNRGLTVAKTVSAKWSNDSRFVLVSTSRGTVHVYPINPLGGKATPETHLSDIVKNERELARLSVTVNALARVKAPKLPTPPSMKDDALGGKDGDNKERNALYNASPPEMLLVPSDSLPVHGPNASRPVARSASSKTIPLLLFYPHLHSILQSSLCLSSSPKTAPSDAPLSTRVTSQAVSGLTQMMRSRGSQLPTLHSETLLARQEWMSQWPLALEEGLLEDEVRVDLSSVNMEKNEAGSRRMRITSAHEAELHSFSHAPAVLPRSIYLAQILTFHTYPPGTASKQGGIVQQFSSGNFIIPKSTKVTVREEVSHRLGTYAGQPFDESTELHSAMHTILDATNLSSSQGSLRGQGQTATDGFASPSSNSPAFPNGYGKSSSSTKWLPSPSTLASLPIPIGISPQTVRQAVTKVRKYSASMRSPRLNAVGSSTSAGVAGGGHSLQGSTLSFEDEDAVLAQVPPEMLEIDEEGVDLGRRPRQHRSRDDQAAASLRPHTYGSPSPAPLPSLSVGGTASSAESQAAKSTESIEDAHRAGMRAIEDPSPPLHAASIADEEGRNEGEWESFKLEGIDDEEDLRNSATVFPVKQKLPSPLLSHAMLPILAAKSEQANASKSTTNKETVSNASKKSEEQNTVLSVPETFKTSIMSPGTALDMAYKPLEPEAALSVEQDVVIEAPLISPTLSVTAPSQEPAASPSPLSSSPAVSSAAEFSASPATAAVLANKRNNKKKNKKGKA